MRPRYDEILIVEDVMICSSLEEVPFRFQVFDKDDGDYRAVGNPRVSICDSALEYFLGRLSRMKELEFYVEEVKANAITIPATWRKLEWGDTVPKSRSVDPIYLCSFDRQGNHTARYRRKPDEWYTADLKTVRQALIKAINDN